MNILAIVEKNDFLIKSLNCIIVLLVLVLIIYIVKIIKVNNK